MKLIPILVFSLFAFCSCHEETPPLIAKKDSEPIPVKTMMVEKKEGQHFIEVSGQFTTEDEVLVSFKTGGIVNRLFVKEGDVVRKGQLLATLQLAEINAQVQQAVIAQEKALRDFQRADRLYKDSVATLEQYQNSKTGLEIAQQQLQAARFNRQHSEIRSNTNGYVLRKMVAEGQLARPGEPVYMLNGAFNGNWILKAAVSDRDWSAIQKGNIAIIHTDALQGKELKGEVVRKSEGVDPVTGTFQVLIQVKSKDVKGLASGLFGKAILETKGETHLWQLPYDALLDGDAEEGYVFVTNDGKTVIKQKVSIASISQGHVSISAGLENVKEVIVQGNAYLENGSAIRKIGN